MEKGQMLAFHDEKPADSMVTLAMVCRTQHAWERLRGLLGRPPLAVQEALWITPCNSVHGFFMRYAIDLIYLDRELRACKCVEAMKPWRVSGCRGASSVIELPAGRIRALGLTTGWRFQWREA